MVTVLGAGVPFGANTILLPVNSPTALALLPSEFNVPSKLARPAMPLDGSMIPADPMLRLFTFTAVSNGVFAASCELIGPALPETLTPPPPGKLAVSLKGNCDWKEKFET